MVVRVTWLVGAECVPATVVLHCMFLPYWAALSSLNETCPLVSGFSEHVLLHPCPHAPYREAFPALLHYLCTRPHLLQYVPLTSCNPSFTLNCIYGFSFMDSWNILSSTNRSFLSSLKAGGTVHYHCLAWHVTWWIHKKYAPTRNLY